MLGISWWQRRRRTKDCWIGNRAVAAPTGWHVRRDDIAVAYLGSFMYYSMLVITTEKSLFTTCRQVNMSYWEAITSMDYLCRVPYLSPHYQAVQMFLGKYLRLALISMQDLCYQYGVLCRTLYSSNICYSQCGTMKSPITVNRVISDCLRNTSQYSPFTLSGLLFYFFFFFFLWCDTIG